jgi:hypothetical protein
MGPTHKLFPLAHSNLTQGLKGKFITSINNHFTLPLANDPNQVLTDIE